MTAGHGSRRADLVRRFFATRFTATRPAARPAPRDEEAGFTLVEILITVWIMGAVMTAFCGALFTMVRSSDVVRRQTAVETELRRYADAVRAAPYQGCADIAAYPASNNYSIPAMWGQSIQPAGVVDSAPDVQYWVPPNAPGGSNYSDAWVETPPSPYCNTNAADPGFGTGGDTCQQKITLTVSTTGNAPIALSTTVYKRSVETDVEAGVGCD